MPKMSESKRRPHGFLRLTLIICFLLGALMLYLWYRGEMEKSVIYSAEGTSQIASAGIAGVCCEKRF
jgi:hypothetical protein